MSKGTPSNFFDFDRWFGRSGGHGWGHHASHNGPKDPSPSPSSGGATGPTTTLTVAFESEEAAYASAMGWYNARTGEAGILFKNTNDDGWNAGVKAGDTRTLTVLQSDVDANNIGFFLIPNGANELSSSLLSSAMKFKVGSNGDGKIVIDRQYGHDVVLSGSEVLFSNQVHNKGDFDYVSGKVGTEGQTKQQKMGTQSDGPDGILGTMAWDDQAMNSCGGTDRDFNDVVFTVTKQGSSNPPTNSAPTDINLSSAIISENAAGGVIGMLSTVDSNVGDKHTYSVSDSRFEVVDGQLKLKSGTSLNFESASSIQVDVTTTDQGGLSYSENLTIAVKNVNEAPTDISISNLSASENASGAVVGMVTTIDPDAGDQHSYSVSDSRFEIVNGQLKFKSGVSLDYESQSSVQLQVTTIDQGGLGYSETFTIEVKDVSEATNAVPTSVVLNGGMVTENVIGAVIGTLTTTDPDVGDTHTYEVDDSRFEVVGNQLQLRSGVSLDFEDDSSIAVNVTTTDQGGLSYSDNFFIFVKNVNEAPTDISISNLSVNENAAAAVIGKLSTTDPDAGNTHSYTVSDNRFEVVNGELKLAAGKSLDYEAGSSVQLQITTKDQGGLSYTENFTIKVNDVSEPVNGAPTDIALSGGVLSENAEAAVVGTLSTVDPDAGDTHTYQVSDDRFEVVGNQLQLKSGVSLNYEEESSFGLTVTTTDKGGLSYSEDLTITVKDVSEAPVDIVLFPTSVAENDVGAVVGNLVAIDEDGGDMHTYTVDDQRFEVVGNQLRLTAGSSLDYEEEPTVTLNVTATDKAGNTFTTAVTVDVQDVDEGNAGLMAFGTGTVDTFLLDLGQDAVTTLVGFSRANDRLSFGGVADANSNGSIGLSDLFAMVSGVSDFGPGGDIVVDFSTGASLIFQGAGTAGGSVTSMSNLVSSPSTQYQFA